MTIVEEKESEYRSRLSLWRNTENEVYIEVGLDGEENDPYSQQSIVLGVHDARILLLELRRIISEIESEAETVTQTKTQSQANALPNGIPNGTLNGVIVDRNPSTDGGNKPRKSNGDVHARYAKDENGQLQLMSKSPVRA